MNHAEQFSIVVRADLGSAPEHIEPGRLHRYADALWCKLFPDGLGGVYGSWRDGSSFNWRAVDRDRMTATERTAHLLAIAETKKRRQVEQQAEYEKHAERINRMWSETVAVTAGDPVALYLRNRGLAGPVPECLRLHRRALYWGEGERSTHPAMIAPLIGADGRLLALHRTYLTTDGRKASVPTVKKVTGAAGPLIGACIPLFKPKDGVIGVAEGIETALAANLASGLPTVAAYSASTLASYVWPLGLRCLVIFADADSAGSGAAEKLRQRARASGLAVLVKTPSTPGLDWCDVWARRGIAGNVGVQS